MGEIARVLIYGDPHLHSKNYGAHNDYANESLECFKKITDAVEKYKVNVLLGLGDFTYGRFHTLEYRAQVEEQLVKQYKLVNGNHMVLKGNHDSAGYGMTEYEYYISKGMFQAARNFTLGCVHFTLVDSGKYNEVIPNIGGDQSINVLLAHDFFKFKDTQMPDFGKHIELDEFTRWYGVDHIICGHIHSQHKFEGLMINSNGESAVGHRVTVQYPGAMSRPSYREGHMDTKGQLILLTLYDDDTMKYEEIDIELLPLDQSFNLAVKEKEKAKEAEKENRVDISDIISNLSTHERSVGNPEDIIMSMEGIDDKYKKKAIDLLKLGQA